MRNIEEDVHKRIISLIKTAVLANGDNVVPDPDIKNVKTDYDDAQADGNYLMSSYYT